MQQNLKREWPAPTCVVSCGEHKEKKDTKKKEKKRERERQHKRLNFCFTDRAVRPDQKNNIRADEYGPFLFLSLLLFE